MRKPLLLFLLCCTSALIAQKSDPFFQLNAPVQQQLAPPSNDCFQRNFNAGLSAQNRGDCKAALRYFREASLCPDLRGNNRRTNELNAVIELCENQEEEARLKGAEMSAATAPRRPAPISTANTRVYRHTQQFLSYAGDSCHDITRLEADRAFALRYWDDAAKLYRAAKQCADADQAERQQMTERVNACRQAAENELLQKEQEAVRQTRHALAGNLADEAQAQLRKNNRTLAYRLADFANQYIAPDDNPYCIQAILDAWYNTPARNSSPQAYRIQSPFCYQIADNLPANALVVTIGRGINARVLAYVPDQTHISVWDANTFEPLDPIVVDDKILAAEASPDGYTLLITTANAYVLWNWQRQSIRIDVAPSGRHCFNSRSDAFYYYNAAENAIFLIKLRDMFIARKGNTKKTTPIKYVSGVENNLAAMALHEGKWWLAYPDRLDIIGKPREGEAWKREKRYFFGTLSGSADRVYLHPETRLVLAVADSATFFRIDDFEGKQTTIEPFRKFLPMNMVVSRDLQHIASIYYDEDNYTNMLRIEHLEDSLTRSIAWLKTDFWGQQLNGDFSFEGKWFFGNSQEGILYGWEVKGKQAEATKEFPNALDNMFTPDGHRLVQLTDIGLEVYQLEMPGTVFDRHNVPARHLNAVGQEWAAYQLAPDSLHLHHFPSERNWHFPATTTETGRIPVCISPDDRYVAYADEPRSIVIRSLESGAVVAARTFDNELRQLHFIPGAAQLLVVETTLDAIRIEPQAVGKIWDFSQRANKPRALRLHDYDIKIIDISKQGDRIAISDEKDVRIFSANNLIDEQTRIYRNRELGISAICFSDNGEVMAVAYQDGSVEFWDTRSGHPLNRLSDLSGMQGNWARSMCFTDNGARLRQINRNQALVIRDIDPFVIGNKAQTEFKQLAAFTPSQIREYNLEDALKYPGNFERLAGSGENTLIQAFFDYYHLQSLRSNNIEQVRNYCELAMILYSQLKRETRQRLQPTIVAMYRDFHWKWLLRENLAEARAVAGAMVSQVGANPVAVEMSAYNALQAGNLQQASADFARWTLLGYNNRMSESFWPGRDTLVNNFRQLAAYDLLGEPQRACICGMFAELADLGFMCPEGGNLDQVPFDAQTARQWRILLLRTKAAQTLHYDKKNQLLQQALKELNAGRRSKAQGDTDQLDMLVAEIAQNYLQWGQFEQNAPKAAEMLEKSLQILRDHETQYGTLDSTHLNIRLLALEALGQYWLIREATGKAQEIFVAEYDALMQLSKSIRDTLSWWGHLRRYQAIILEHLATIALLEGQTDAALQRYQQASEVMDSGINTFYAGTVYAFAGDRISAFLNFGDMYEATQLGDVIFTLERLATRFPTRADSLRLLIPDIKSAVLKRNARFVSEIVDAQIAQRMTTRYAAFEKWDSAALQSAEMVRLMEKAMSRGDSTEEVIQWWLNTQISWAYYRILWKWKDPETLNQVISTTENVIAYVRDNMPYFMGRDYLLSNLGHAYLLRNQPGDRARAIGIYRNFVQAPPQYSQDYQMVLEKDFRDLRQARVPIPDPEALLREILANE
jgi:WD40 repeat protein